MSEATGEKPPLTGLDLVLQQALYGLMRYPQADMMPDTLVLNAILSDRDPVALIELYLGTSLTEETLNHVLERARRAHTAYLPEDKIPSIDSANIHRIWEAGKHKLEEALLHLLGKIRKDEADLLDKEADRIHPPEPVRYENLPLAELKAVAAAATAAFKDPKITALLEKYRERFREEHFAIEDEDERVDKVLEEQAAIQKEVVADMRAHTKREGLDEKKLERVFQMFEGIEKL